MNPLVKKEVRLVLPGWILAMVLALLQACTRPYDFYIAVLLFFGLTVMGLSTIGRETSLNTFSSMLAQPGERLRLWNVKLTVLAFAFLTVLCTWLVAYLFAGRHSDMAEYDAGWHPVMGQHDTTVSGYLFVTVCLSAVATFTGGLWSTLLIRQLAGAFWLTLLVPAVMSGIVGGFLSSTDSDNAVIAGLTTLICIYAVGGFFFARWLFFRAQDVGWSGGNLVLPEWKIFSAAASDAPSARRRKPFIALLKKELQLQQFSLWAAGGLLIAHIGVLIWRSVHQFPRNSAGETFSEIFWMLWLALPVVFGTMSIAEERKLGVMESLLCLPVSRRRQYVLKAFLVLFLGTLLGGFLPMFLEFTAIHLSGNNPFKTIGKLPLVITALAGGLALVSFFASSFAKNFLQAIGYAIATVAGFMLLVPFFTNNRMVFFDSIAERTLLPFVVAVPTIVITLLWLAWLNFNNFREGWLLWRRNLLGLVTAVVFVIAASSALYNRVWDVFQPAEPAHGPARLSFANPPVIVDQDYTGDLLVKLPDGRIWFDEVGFEAGRPNWLRSLWNVVRYNFNPYPYSLGPGQYVTGSSSMPGTNWVSSVMRNIDTLNEDNAHIQGYLETVGVKSDGTLWTLGEPGSTNWNSGPLAQLGNGTDWKAVSWPFWEPSIVLLKKDGTLWCWGTNRFAWTNPPASWPRLQDFTPYQIGTDSDWQAISPNGNYLQKTDGTVWEIARSSAKDRHLGFLRQTNWDDVALDKLSENRDSYFNARIHKDGSLWLSSPNWNSRKRTFITVRYGTDTNWVDAECLGWNRTTIALKSDGTLWRWYDERFSDPVSGLNTAPAQLGIHNDWVALGQVRHDVVAIAADGSVWLWPRTDPYAYYPKPLLKLPQQPPYLGNIFAGSD